MSIEKRPNVIQDVISAVEAGRLRISTHAQQRMKERDIQVSDLEEAIYNSRREDEKDSLNKSETDWKYSLRGLNSDGDKDLRIVVAYDDPRMVVVTAIDKNKESDDV